MGLVYDYDLADDYERLGLILHEINRRGYTVVAVTQNGEQYTVVFQRPLDGKYSRW